MRKIAKLLIFAVLLCLVFAQATEAATWKISQVWPEGCDGPVAYEITATGPNGNTVNIKAGQLASPDEKIQASMPSNLSDWHYKYWCLCGGSTCGCAHEDNPLEKVFDKPQHGNPKGRADVWWLEDLRSWMDQELDGWLELPDVTDPSNAGSGLYVHIDLGQCLANPPVFQDSYIIVDGTCPDLPGYLIGTTPIVFDSLAPPPPGGYPMTTTPYTGTMPLHGTVSFIGSQGVPSSAPSLTEYGMIVLALALLASGLWIYRKKKPGATA